MKEDTVSRGDPITHVATALNAKDLHNEVAKRSNRCSGCDGSFGRGMQVNALQGFTVDELKLNLW